MNEIFPLVFPERVPFRLRVQKSLTAALQQITPANGFENDMSDFFDDRYGGNLRRVYRGRDLFGDNDPLPMLSILEDPLPPDNDLAPYDGAAGTVPYALMIQGFLPDDPEDPTDPAHILLADVKVRLIQLREDVSHPLRVFRFGKKANTVSSLTFDSGVVRPADQVSAVAYFWLRVTLDLAEDNLNPFG